MPNLLSTTQVPASKGVQKCPSLAKASIKTPAQVSF